MSQRPKRDRAQRQYYDENSENLDPYDELGEDDGDGRLGRSQPARGHTAGPSQGPAASNKRPRRAVQVKREPGREETDEDDDHQDAMDEENDDDFIGDSDDEDDGARHRGKSAARGAASRGRGGRGVNAGSSRRGRGRGRGGGAAAAAPAADEGSSDSEVIVISDSDDSAGAQAPNTQAPNSQVPNSQAARTSNGGGAGGRGRGGGSSGRGRGRGRGRGFGGGAASQPPEQDGDYENADGGGEEGAGMPGGSLGGGGDAAAAAAAEPVRRRRSYVPPPVPLTVNAEELASMRRLIKRYRDEWEAARERCDVWDSLSDADQEEMARVVVRYMLFAARARPRQPVARAKLTEAFKKAMANNKHYRKLGPVWLPWARYMAISKLGYDIAEVNRPKPGALDPAAAAAAAAAAGAAAGPSSAAAAGASSAAAAAAASAAVAEGSQYFLLRTALPTALRLEFVGSDTEGEGEGLLVVVLALILSNGGKMDEDMLRRLLVQLGWAPDCGEAHPRLGGLEEALKRWQEQRYVLADKRAADGSSVLTWGEAAHSEIGVQGVTRLMDTLYDGLERKTAASAADGDGEAGDGDAGAGAGPSSGR
ncbi:hypothetical protein Agub_g10616 [Astrephomene gubernaculifera]|uniref:MAGE domain-containing protein n=1 Tax=Astrephomene gubernaculifera TaxID=47775 RepID=A0AAD3DZM3_9CHLO|nr:hypothetical protein Agub_g10616 [Astrephomene gubernaculifera]